MWLLMRFDEIKTLDECDAYLEQMYALYSMPKNTEHFHEYWASVTKSVAEKRNEIMGENRRRMILDPAKIPQHDHHAGENCSLSCPRREYLLEMERLRVSRHRRLENDMGVITEPRDPRSVRYD